MTNLSLRDRRHQQAEKDFGRLQRQRDETLDKLARIAAKIKATRRSIERYQRTPTLLSAPRPVVVAAPANVEPPAPVAAPASGSIDDLAIPTFLQRGIAAQKAADQVIADQIKREQAERKKNKARVRNETAKAKQAGETKRMPLTGKAALEYLKTGKRPEKTATK